MIKPKGKLIARFHANDVRVASKFAEYLSNMDEHRFQVWEEKTDEFALYFYIDMKGDEEDEVKARQMLRGLFTDDLIMRGIFDFRLV